ncbi:conserved hypothetical protein [Onion yellows phytoplasma OY-M]|uniref:Uncharacterized protein n=1 Tax=Onion yellows phytoplasma (strain OY-M) TaxID=262768 RepID=Q6YQI9_ONYPE|nr:conserved hypothetical protein [Onion yellows phytoplasma OY-M]
MITHHETFRPMKTSYTSKSILFQKSPDKMKKLINHFPKFWNTKWILNKLNHSTPPQYIQNLR